MGALGVVDASPDPDPQFLPCGGTELLAIAFVRWSLAHQARNLKYRRNRSEIPVIIPSFPRYFLPFRHNGDATLLGLEILQQVLEVTTWFQSWILV